MHSLKDVEYDQLQRVVNSMLIMLEKYIGKGFIVTATNRESTLHEALWRRLNDVLLFDRSTVSKSRSMLKLRTKNFKNVFEITEKAEKMKGFSFTEIERVCAQAIKLAILDRKRAMREEEIDVTLTDEMRRRKVQR